jgi:ABC-type branched-subunit amino acid transport system substrate-binding protein
MQGLSELSTPSGVSRLRLRNEGGVISTSKTSSAVIFAIAAGILASLIPGPTNGAESCEGSCAAGNISLAVVAAMRGQPAATTFGAQVSKPVELAVRHLNASGGILGKQISLGLADDKCDPGLALDAANRHLERDKPSAVIGPICPGAATAAAPVYGKAELPELLPTVSPRVILRSCSRSSAPSPAFVIRRRLIVAICSADSVLEPVLDERYEFSISEVAKNV